VSPQLDYSVAVGVNRISSAGSGWIGNASLNYVIDEKSSLVGTISRNVTPTGLGGFLEIDNFGLNYLYDINQKNHLGADANWSITRDVNNSNFKRLGTFYAYDISEDWGIRTYAQYRTLQATNVDADAYLIGISLSYNNPNLF
jgi:opacity protein-like surface antigen